MTEVFMNFNKNTTREIMVRIDDTVNIGDVSYKLKNPKNPELVPQNYSKK